MNRYDVIVIGGGPAGLAAAEAALTQRPGLRLLIVDQMPSFGRKFLMAGKSGLNLTFDAPAERFLTAYGAHADFLKSSLDGQGPASVRRWAQGLGQETFVSPSGRVFPRAMKASPLLRAWLARLRNAGAEMRVRTRLVGWPEPSERGAWRLQLAAPDGPARLLAGAVVLALGGASWPRLGSDGAWAAAAARLLGPAAVEPFQPSNAGLTIPWAPWFAEKFAGAPVKAVRATLGVASVRAEGVVTRWGLEGSLAYALCAAARAELAQGRAASLWLDLAPDRPEADLAAALAQPRGKLSRANWLRRAVRLSGVKAALLSAVAGDVPSGAGPNPDGPAALAARIKHVALPVSGVRPLAEAISSAGGLACEALDENGMVREAPGLFAAGEMVAWDAPTGGYLLTACFATGRRAGAAAATWAAAARDGSAARSAEEGSAACSTEP